MNTRRFEIEVADPMTFTELRDSVRCVVAISGRGIEVGDRCKIQAGYYVPLVRWYSEGGGNDSKPFNRIKIEESVGFKFLKEEG